MVALGLILLAVRHIGPTAILTIQAISVLNLLFLVTSLPEIEGRQADIEALGYEWRGELGLRGGGAAAQSQPPQPGEGWLSFVCSPAYGISREKNVQLGKIRKNKRLFSMVFGGLFGGRGVSQIKYLNN